MSMRHNNFSTEVQLFFSQVSTGTLQVCCFANDDYLAWILLCVGHQWYHDRLICYRIASLNGDSPFHDTVGVSFELSSMVEL